jgi:hypothetical protein
MLMFYHAEAEAYTAVEYGIGCKSNLKVTGKKNSSWG